ncbi:MAG: OB-fold nucleic acid binding domain-containing protein [Candidatus Bathyarchaeia archaeon]
MVDVESLISQITSKLEGVSREEILKRLEDKKQKTGGLISNEVLLRTIAAELGVKVAANKTEEPTLLIGKLVPGLSDVTVTGRVIAIFPPKDLKRGKKSEKARTASLIIADKSGTIHVVLWNNKTVYAEKDKVKVGQILRFRHGYTKEGRLGNVELHIGEKGEIEIEHKDAETEIFPKITELVTKIGALGAFKNKRVNIIGEVKKLSKASAFTRQDFTAGKVMRLSLVDETGEIPVVIWGDKVEDAEKLAKEGAKLYIANAIVKKALGESLELHVDSKAYLDTFTEELGFLKIAELKDGLKGIHVKGEVATKPLIREVKTLRGETVKLAVFEIKDETGKIWVSAWRKNAEIAANLKVGSKIAIKNANVKKGFGDQLEISTQKTTTLEIALESSRLNKC